MNEWGDKGHPITRFKKYVMDKGWWDDAQEKAWQNEVREHYFYAVYYWTSVI